MMRPINLLPRVSFFARHQTLLMIGIVGVLLVGGAGIAALGWTIRQSGADYAWQADKARVEIASLEKRKAADPEMTRYEAYAQALEAARAGRIDWTPRIRAVDGALPAGGTLLSAVVDKDGKLKAVLRVDSMADATAYIARMADLEGVAAMNVVSVRKQLLPADEPAGGDGAGGAAAGGAGTEVPPAGSGAGASDSGGAAGTAGGKAAAGSAGGQAAAGSAGAGSGTGTTGGNAAGDAAASYYEGVRERLSQASDENEALRNELQWLFERTAASDKYGLTLPELGDSSASSAGEGEAADLVDGSAITEAEYEAARRQYEAYMSGGGSASAVLPGSGTNGNAQLGEPDAGPIIVEQPDSAVPGQAANAPSPGERAVPLVASYEVTLELAWTSDGGGSAAGGTAP